MAASDKFPYCNCRVPARLGAEPRRPRAGRCRPRFRCLGSSGAQIWRWEGSEQAVSSSQCSFDAMGLHAFATAALLLGLLAGFAEGGIVSGGAGHGLLFQGQRSDAASVYLTPPSGHADEPGHADSNKAAAVTIEFWLKKIDKHIVSVPFSYSPYNDSAVPAPPWPSPSSRTFMYEVGEYGVWKFSFAGAVFDCPRANCTFGWDAEWQHIAIAFNAGQEAGYVKAYRNGLLVFDSSLLDPPLESFRPMSFPGVLVLGQVRQTTPKMSRLFFSPPARTANLAVLCTIPLPYQYCPSVA